MTSDVQRDPLIEQFAVPLARAMMAFRVQPIPLEGWKRKIEGAACRAFARRRMRDTGSPPKADEIDAFVARLRERAQERC